MERYSTPLITGKCTLKSERVTTQSIERLQLKTIVPIAGEDLEQ